MTTTTALHQKAFAARAELAQMLQRLIKKYRQSAPLANLSAYGRRYNIEKATLPLHFPGGIKALFRQL